MEISDDKVMDILMDTNKKVTLTADRLKTHCDASDVRHKSHDERIGRLEREANMEPLDKNIKYYSKKAAPWTMGLSLLVYIIYDVYIKIKGG